tara:strand:- start:640 stop:1266 length:627 start_codon:yes stop_codon:yes gene_type:complete
MSLAAGNENRVVRQDLTNKAIQINENYLFTAPVQKPFIEKTPDEKEEEYIIPGDIIARAQIEGSGQPGNIYEDYFPQIEVSSQMTPVKIVLVLRAPKYNAAGEEQSMMRITHSPRTGRNNHLEIDTSEGKRRLYLNSDGTLTREIDTGNREYNPFGEVNQMKPGGKGIEFISTESEILVSGKALYHLRVTDTRLGRMTFDATLSILPD